MPKWTKVQTFSGKYINILDPQPQDFAIEDIDLYKPNIFAPNKSTPYTEKYIPIGSSKRDIIRFFSKYGRDVNLKKDYIFYQDLDKKRISSSEKKDFLPYRGELIQFEYKYIDSKTRGNVLMIQFLLLDDKLIFMGEKKVPFQKF